MYRAPSNFLITKGQQKDKMTPTPPPGFIGALVPILGGALAIALVGAALNARQAREEPHGDGDSDSTGENNTRNETQRRRPLRTAPPPRAIERQNPDGGLRDLEEARVERGGGGGEEVRRNMKILIEMVAIRVMFTVMMLFKIGSKTNIIALLNFLLSFGIILYFFFRICIIL